MQKQIHIQGIGKIQIRKSNKARRISLRIRPGYPAEVILPTWESFHQGERFAKKKKDWILKHYNRNKNNVRPALNNQSILKTAHKDFRLIFSAHESDFSLIRISDHAIHIWYKKGLEIESPEIRNVAETGILMALKLEARKYLPSRLHELAYQFGYSYRQLFLKNQKTLWGSCSAQNNINLNIQIMRLPVHLIDYILVHELVHTKHKNHGNKFWDELDACVENAHALARELRKHRIFLSA